MNEIDYAIIGHPLAHTMSPFIHARLFALSGKRCGYAALDIPTEVLGGELKKLKALRGFNITIPHKQTIIPFLDELSEKSRLFGSVNTVQNRDGRLIGHTTDGAGFCGALKAAGVSLNGRTVVAGAGGAGRVLAFEAALAGADVTLAVRPHRLAAAEAVALDIRSKVKNARIACCSLNNISGKIDLLVNATPVGMYPETAASPVSEETVRGCACIFDAVYNPDQTALMKLARRNGVRAIGGMSMLVRQAAQAHKIWYGAQLRTEDLDVLCEDSVTEMKKTFGNIILCGCMGSGKTTVGKCLAQMTGRQFVDMDAYIEQTEKMTVNEIFSARGEAFFRRLEQYAAKELSAKSGFVIATGGGTFLNPENTALLKETGVTVFLDATAQVLRQRLRGDRTRPLLAQANGEKVLEELCRVREAVYRAAADFTVSADDSADSVAEKICWKLKIPLIQS